MPLQFITQPPTNTQPAQHLLVALHGWGANCHDLTVLADALNLPDYQFLFPDAPFKHPQVPGGRAWYALERGDREGLAQSREQLRELLTGLEVETGIPLTETVLLGFSQGGAMTLDVGNTLPLKGLCCLSGYPHSPLTVSADPKPPVLMIHGQRDPVVPVTAAQQAKQELEQQGSTITYQEFTEMGHEIPPDAIALTAQFIQAIGNGQG